MHRFAKQTVATWVRGRSRVGANFKGLQPVLDLIPMQPKSASPMFGVYEEYPVCTSKIGLLGVAASEWKSSGVKASKAHGIPLAKDIGAWNEKCSKEQKLKLEWLFDVGVVDPVTSKLCFVIEIRHTNPMTDEKIAWLDEQGISWLEMSADACAFSLQHSGWNYENINCATRCW